MRKALALYDCNRFEECLAVLNHLKSLNIQDFKEVVEKLEFQAKNQQRLLKLYPMDSEVRKSVAEYTKQILDNGAKINKVKVM